MLLPLGNIAPHGPYEYLDKPAPLRELPRAGSLRAAPVRTIQSSGEQDIARNPGA